MSINIYIANHNSLNGIKDILSILIDFFEGENCHVQISTALDTNRINVVIDEFTSIEVINYIRTFRAYYPNITLILIATEFLDKLKISNREILTFNPYMDDENKKYFQRYIEQKFNTVRGLKKKINRFLDKYYYKNFKLISREIYNYKRAMGFLSIIEHFDLIFCIDFAVEALLRENLKIYNGKILGTVLPVFDAKRVGSIIKTKSKSIGDLININLSGSITGYRKQVIRKINKIYKRHDNPRFILHVSNFKSEIIQDFQIQSRFSLNELDIYQYPEIFKKISRNDALIEDGLFSLHIPQEPYWTKVSPTRIYRSIVYNFEIPILYGVYESHAILDICLHVPKMDELNNLKLEQFCTEPKLNTWLEHVEIFNSFSLNNNKQLYKLLFSKIAIK